MGFLKIKALKGIKIQVNNGEKTGMNNSPKIENASHIYMRKSSHSLIIREMRLLKGHGIMQKSHF